MDLSPTFVCCFGCPLAIRFVATAILIALAGLVPGRALTAWQGQLARGLGHGLALAGSIAGLFALLSIARFGVAWTSGWAPVGSLGDLDTFVPLATRQPIYDGIFGLGWLVAMVAIWVAVPRIVAAVRAGAFLARP